MQKPKVLYEIHAIMPDGGYNIEEFLSKSAAVKAKESFKFEAVLTLVKVERTEISFNQVK